MSLSIKILDCNGACRACYERPARLCQTRRGYDIEAIMATLERELAGVTDEQKKRGESPCVHGGEPLLIRPADLRRIMGAVFRVYGKTGIQTNATLIDEGHIALFQEFKTHVGISLDGDSALLNRGRWNDWGASLNLAQEMTETVLYNMGRLKGAGVPMSVIAVLRTYNAAPAVLPEFKRFLLRLRDDFGIVSVRTNKCIVYDAERRPEEELSPGELGRALISLAELCFSDRRHDWRPYRDVVDAMMGKMDRLTCFFNGCDPWHTTGERTICADGSIGGCLKSGAGPGGIQALNTGRRMTTRSEILTQISREQGGCRDCEWWGLCHGGCPGEGIDNDWRNRTRFCAAWRMLYFHVKRRVSGLLARHKVPDFSFKVAGLDWSQGRGNSHGDSHGDKYSDIPHGDHTDGGGPR